MGSNDTFGYRVFKPITGTLVFLKLWESDTMLVRGQIMGIASYVAGVFDAGIGLSIGTTAAKISCGDHHSFPSGEDWELVDRQADGYKWQSSRNGN